ncbi:MAG: efflux RND transporter periplasmic adaptor subunit [Bacteroidota bacterium]
MEKPAIRKIIETVSASGKIQPETEVKISPDVPGEITELYVREGQLVKKGETLCVINPMLYITSRQRMEATLNSTKASMANMKARFDQAKSAYTNAEIIFQRNRKLFDAGAISQADIDAARTQFESAKAEMEAAQQNVNAGNYNIRSAEASLLESDNNLSRTVIRAPVDGRISKLNVEKGERVVGTSQMAGTELLRIANLNEMEVVVDVNENDIVKIHMNDTANVEVEAYLGKKFKGLVTSIANSANTSGTSADQVTSFEVKVRILRESYAYLLGEREKDASPFRPGMTATVDIMTRTEKNALSIPIQSVTTRTDTLPEIKSGKKEKAENGEVDTAMAGDKEPIELVFVHRDGKVIVKPVKIGIQDNTYIQILSGISGQDEVVVAPYKAISRRLKNQSRISIRSREELLGEKEP